MIGEKYISRIFGVDGKQLEQKTFTMNPENNGKATTTLSDEARRELLAMVSHRLAAKHGWQVAGAEAEAGMRAEVEAGPSTRKRGLSESGSCWRCAKANEECIRKR